MKSIAKFLVLVLLILVVIAGFVFILNNDQPTGLWLVTELPPQAVGLWVLGAFIAGGLAGMLLGYGLWNRMKLHMQLSAAQKKLTQSQQEIIRLQQLLKAPDNREKN